MRNVLMAQKTEANSNFSRFIDRNYVGWIKSRNEKGASAPVMSHNLFFNKVLPLLDNADPVYFIVMDNLRYDQWKVLQPMFTEYFRVQEDTCYFSILPTATNYARNSIFAGLLPIEIEKRFP